MIGSNSISNSHLVLSRSCGGLLALCKQARTTSLKLNRELLATFGWRKQDVVSGGLD